MKLFVTFFILVFIGFNTFSIADSDEDKDKMITYAAKGDLGKVAKYIKNGVDVNAKNRARWTALAYASKYGHFDIVKYLVEHGADVNLTVNVGSTPLQIALNYKHYDIAKYLLKNGADVNIPDITGMTALAWAAKNGNLDEVKFLVENGADVNSKNVNARTILDITVDYEVKKYLISKGAKTGKQLLEEAS
ncbi:MAG: hypothetical protein Kow0068_15440 [Marinilabiliales bacterium]